jgi:two-component system chemotaxis response regulator CheY
MSIRLEDYHVLVIDDSSSSRILTQGLLKIGGINDVKHAENGQQALSILQDKSNHINCIISDFNMPVMHGLTMVKKIRVGYNHIRRDIPIMLLTGFNDHNLIGIAIALDVNAFIVKPPQIDTFSRRFKTMMEVQNKYESWLKPVDSYIGIDTDTSIQSLLQRPKITESSNINDEIDPSKDEIDPSKDEKEQSKDEKNDQAIPSDRIKKAIRDHHRKQDLVQRNKPKSDSSSSLIIDDPIPKDPYLKKTKTRNVTIEKVPINSILAEDIVNKNQVILLRKHVKLTADMIERLKDLTLLDQPVKRVLIYPPKE